MLLSHCARGEFIRNQSFSEHISNVLKLQIVPQGSFSSLVLDPIFLEPLEIVKQMIHLVDIYLILLQLSYYTKK
jgi:hypothetical protein